MRSSVVVFRRIVSYPSPVLACDRKWDNAASDDGYELETGPTLLFMNGDSELWRAVAVGDAGNAANKTVEDEQLTIEQLECRGNLILRSWLEKFD